MQICHAIAITILVTSISHSSALVTRTKSRVSGKHLCRGVDTDDDAPHQRWRFIGCNHLQHLRRPFMLNAKWENGDDDFRDEVLNNEEDGNNASSPSPSSIISDRIQRGNLLDVLALSVTLFFLATAWLSGGRLFNDSTNTYNSSSEGKARIYKYVDADKLLQEEFDNNESKVTFE